MDHPTGTRRHLIRHREWLARAACAALLGWLATATHAAPIYKCVDADNHPTFRDTPCATHAQQTKLDIAGQPLIDPGAPRLVETTRTSRSGARPRTSRRTSGLTRKPKPPMSWECRAADGQVFYRHTRCPGSVPGDGVVRTDYGQTRSRSRARTRGRHDAWSPVPVHGVKVSRAEACRRIHATDAVGRDGRQRDETVSTYDHLVGRDPCQ